MASVLSLALVAVIATGATLAYFTDTTGEVKNVFTVGNVDIDLDEDNWTDDSQIMPGIRITKEPYVKNIGKNDAYVRVKVTFNKWDTISKFATNGAFNDSIVKDFAGDKWDVSPSVVENNNEATYTLIYKGVMPVGSEVKHVIFKGIEFPTILESTDIEKLDGFTITIKAEAIQSEGFEDVDGGLTAQVGS